MTASTRAGAAPVERTPSFHHPTRVVLPGLLSSTRTAREQMLDARRAPHDRAELETARLAYLRWLATYERALTELALPVPRRLRDDLRLLRQLARGDSPD